MIRTWKREKERFDSIPPEKRRWWILWTLMVGSLIAGLDATIVNVSIPALMNDFSEPVTRVQWVISAYMIAFAVLMPVTSWLREQVGSRALYSGCLFTFTLASVLCGFAWNLESLVFFRVLQALGAGAMTPIAMSILAETFPPSQKGRALGIWGAGVVLGPVFGAPLGGFLTEFAGWRSIFLVNLPFGLLGMAAVAFVLRKDRPKKRIDWKSFNFPGYALFSGFLLCLLYGAALAEMDGFASQGVSLCAILSVLFLIAFMISEMRSPSTLLDFSLFQSQTFTIAIAISLVRSFALYGGQFLLPLFLARVQGYGEHSIGLMILPGSVAIAAIFPFSGRLSDRYGAKPFVVAGLAILVGFFTAMSFVNASSSFWEVQASILARGIALGLLVTPLMSMAIGAVPVSRAANSSVLLNLAQQVGGSLGIASLGSVLELRSRVYLRNGVTEMDALVGGFQDAFTVGIFVCAIAWFMALFLNAQKDSGIDSRGRESRKRGR